MMRAIIIIAVLAYLAGFVTIFAVHTQLPVTLGLALLRSALWPVSVVMRHPYPRGARLETDCDSPDCG